jgi:hypothetical protein
MSNTSPRTYAAPGRLPRAPRRHWQADAAHRGKPGRRPPAARPLPQARRGPWRRAGLVASKRPAMDPCTAGGLLDRFNTSTQAGGANGEASRNLFYRAIARARYSPLQVVAQQEQRMFSIGRMTFGKGPAVGDYPACQQARGAAGRVPQPLRHDPQPGCGHARREGRGCRRAARRLKRLGFDFEGGQACGGIL